jgi:hypothetical protein
LKGSERQLLSKENGRQEKRYSKENNHMINKASNSVSEARKKLSKGRCGVWNFQMIISFDPFFIKI